MVPSSQTEGVLAAPAPPLRARTVERRAAGQHPWDETICATEKIGYENCHRWYLWRKEGRRRLPRNMGMIAGDLAHAGASIDDPIERETALQQALDKVHPEKRVEAEKLARDLISKADAMQDEYIGEVSKDDSLFWWYDNDPNDKDATKFGFVIKPDEMGVTLHMDRRYGHQPREREVLQIADLKSGVKRHAKMPLRVKRQLLFFGMVAALAKVYDWEGPIRLVVKFMGNQEETDMFYARHFMKGDLKDARAIINEIKRKAQEPDLEAAFKPNPGFQCFHCPFSQCAEGARWMAENEHQRPQNNNVVPLTVLTGDSQKAS